MTPLRGASKRRSAQGWHTQTQWICIASQCCVLQLRNEARTCSTPWIAPLQFGDFSGFAVPIRGLDISVARDRLRRCCGWTLPKVCHVPQTAGRPSRLPVLVPRWAGNGSLLMVPSCKCRPTLLAAMLVTLRGRCHPLADGASQLLIIVEARHFLFKVMST